MRNVSDDYKLAIRKSSRSFCSKLIFEKSEITDEDIISISIDESILSGEDFQLGGAISTNVDVEISNYLGLYNETTFKNMIFKLVLGIELQDGNIEYVEYGQYKIFEVKETGKSLKLECYDSFIDMDIPYNTKLQYPMAVSTIINDISKVFKIKLSDNLKEGKFNNSDLIIAAKPDDATYRQILKDIASIVGGFAVIRNGVLDIINIQETDLEINSDNAIKTTIASEYEKISLIELNKHIEGKIGGTKLEVDIPLLDSNDKDDIKKVANSILGIYKDFTYTGFKSEWQGDFSVELGDTVKVIDINGKEYNSLIAINRISYSGGIKSTTEAKVDKKITKTANREVQILQSKIKEAENGMYYYTNNDDTNIISAWSQFAYIGFSLSGSTNLLLNVAIMVEGTGILECKLALDSIEMGFSPKIKVSEFGLMSFTIPLIQLKSTQSHGIGIMLKSDSNMVVKREQGQITIYGDKLSGALSDEYPHAEVQEEIKYTGFDSIKSNLVDSVNVELETTINSIASDEVRYSNDEVWEVKEQVNISIIEFGYINDITEYFKGNYIYNDNAIQITDAGMDIKTLEYESDFLKIGNIYEVEMIDNRLLENIFSEVI